MWVCRLPVHIGPRRLHRFYGNLRRIRNIYRADRVVGPYKKDFDALRSVGADDSVRPQTTSVFMGIFGEFVLPAEPLRLGVPPSRLPLPRRAWQGEAF